MDLDFYRGKLKFALLLAMLFLAIVFLASSGNLFRYL